MQPDETRQTPEEARARDAVHALSGVTADPAYRERLKAEFVSGRLAGGGARPEAVGDRPRTRILPLPVLIPLAAAAVLLIAIFWGTGGPSVEFAGVSGEGTVLVDGRPIATDDTAGLASSIRAGAHLEVPEGISVAIAVPRVFVVEIEQGVGVVPGAPGRWFGRTSTAHLESGEMRMMTGSAFSGSRLEVVTPDGLVRITGTLASAVRGEGGTCVCVHRGGAVVGRGEADLRPVPPGKRLVLHADRSEPLLTEIAPPHLDHLLDFESRLGESVHPGR